MVLLIIILSFVFWALPTEEVNFLHIGLETCLLLCNSHKLFSLEVSWLHEITSSVTLTVFSITPTLLICRALNGAHYSPFTIPYSVLTINYSLFTITYWLEVFGHSHGSSSYQSLLCSLDGKKRLTSTIFDQPGVAGTDLQIALCLIHWLTY